MILILLFSQCHFFPASPRSRYFCVECFIVCDGVRVYACVSVCVYVCVYANMKSASHGRGCSPNATV